MMAAVGHFLTGAGNILLQMGLPGLVIAGLAYTSKKLFDRYCDVQEKRIMEAQAQTTALNANTAALTRMADALMQGSRST